VQERDDAENDRHEEQHRGGSLPPAQPLAPPSLTRADPGFVEGWERLGALCTRGHAPRLALLVSVPVAVVAVAVVAATGVRVDDAAGGGQQRQQSEGDTELAHDENLPVGGVGTLRLDEEQPPCLVRLVPNRAKPFAGKLPS
jgi:hypothetical protein